MLISRYAQYIPKICPRYAMISPRYVHDILKISPRYCQVIPMICLMNLNGLSENLRKWLRAADEES